MRARGNYVILLLLTVISDVERLDHWWFYQRDMLTSHTFHRNQFGIRLSLSLQCERLFSRLSNASNLSWAACFWRGGGGALYSKSCNIAGEGARGAELFAKGDLKSLIQNSI